MRLLPTIFCRSQFEFSISVADFRDGCHLYAPKRIRIKLVERPDEWVGATTSFTIIPLPAVIGLLITALLAFFLGRRIKQSLAILVAGFALPVVTIFAGAYSIWTSEPDGPPLKMVLPVILTAVAVLTPVTLILSWLVVRSTKR